MQKIKKYPVNHPILSKHIKFYWEIKADNIELNHKLIPLRNINLRFNLSDTPHYIIQDHKELQLDHIFFSGLHNSNINTSIKVKGSVDMFGICFYSDGFYPFINTPISDFTNHIININQSNLSLQEGIVEQLKDKTTENKIKIIEKELLKSIHEDSRYKYFHDLFNTLKEDDFSTPLNTFCEHYKISNRTLERMFNKYVGISAKRYTTINRFQNSLNDLLYKDFTKLSDIAYRNGYFDQMHFIKEFKHFTGNPPSTFSSDHNSILHIGRFQ
ncbi:MAG: DUF6597 domain-containing transcriptional factor [Hyphomicrobiales bacterium]